MGTMTNHSKLVAQTLVLSGLGAGSQKPRCGQEGAATDGRGLKGPPSPTPASEITVLASHSHSTPLLCPWVPFPSPKDAGLQIRATLRTLLQLVMPVRRHPLWCQGSRLHPLSGGHSAALVLYL